MCLLRPPWRIGIIFGTVFWDRGHRTYAPPFDCYGTPHDLTFYHRIVPRNKIQQVHVMCFAGQRGRTCLTLRELCMPQCFSSGMASQLACCFCGIALI